MEALLPFVAWTFATLDRTTGEAHVSANLETAITNTSDYDGTPVDVISNRLDLYAELPVGAGFGVVATLPLTLIRGQYDRPETTYNNFGLGAFSVGGYYDQRFELGGGQLSVRPRLDFVLPTASFEGDFDPNTARFAMLFHRLEESADDSGSAWARGGVVGKYRRGPWSAQLDVLLKVAFDEEIQSDFVEGRAGYLSLGAGVGRELGGLQATAEFVIANLEVGGAQRDTSSFMTGVVSLGGHLGDVELRGHFGVPLDEYLRTHVLIFGLSATRPL